MPTNKIDWSKTLIYKIISNDPNDDFIYVGSTTDFTRRWREHKIICNDITRKSYNYKLYQHIRDNGGIDNYKMVLVEKYELCKDKLEARQREQYWIDELKPKLNMYRAYCSDEYNKDHLKECRKKYYEDNKEMINECHKKYREEHREQLKVDSKKNYEDNKDKILKKYYCDCGGKYTLYHKSHHMKSKKHQSWITSSCSLGQEDA